MEWSIVENTPTPQENLFKLFLTSQLPYRAKIKKCSEIQIYVFFRIFLYRPALELLPISEICGPEPRLFSLEEKGLFDITLGSQKYGESMYTSIIIVEPMKAFLQQDALSRYRAPIRHE